MYRIFLVEDESASPEMPVLMPNVSVGWLPEGYEGAEAIQSRLKTTINCTDENGNLICIFVYTEYQTLYTLDIEDADLCKDIMIQGHPALLVYKEGSYRISWADDTSGTYIYLVSNAIDEPILTQVAESISVSW